MAGPTTPLRILVTGGCGFIGSAVVRHLIADTDHEVVNLDKLTYAATLGSVEAVADDRRYRFVHADICDDDAVAEVFDTHRPDAVVHLAAESHVDRSIDGPDTFVHTNVVGTMRLLQQARRRYQQMTGPEQARFRFLHVSTDEVFGSLTLDDPPFHAASPYAPRSPYAATKAAADHLVRAWHHTYGLPTVVTNCSNNYGPYQFPEKLIPLITLRALERRSLPVYGTGANVRDWLHVDDHATALVAVLERGTTGQTHMVGGNAERTNLDIVEAICDILDDRVGGASHRDLIAFVADRPGHDLRYAIDASNLTDTLGWKPARRFDEALAATVDWYLANESWWAPIVAGTYDLDRLGTRPPDETE